MRSHNPEPAGDKSTSPLGLTLLPLLAAAILASLLQAATARGSEPLDLAELGRRGLGERSREIIVAQALSHRARPPLEIGFVLEMASYGGDDLAQAYLEMDAATSQEAASPLPPESMRNLMAAGLAPADLRSFADSSNPALNGQDEEQAPAPAVPVVTSLREGPNAERPLERPSAPEAPGSVAPRAADRPTVVAAARPLDLRSVPQTLAPGQKADPARPLPEAPGPFWTRAPRGDGQAFMGVTEQVKADGHRFEVNTNARGGRLGQEVLGRPSGHKVNRSYSVRPEPAGEATANDFGLTGQDSGQDQDGGTYPVEEPYGYYSGY
ncbi:MAG: hypothetical protein LBP92_07935 [Deltaproteobacteria bacterium]|jgi:hypothetical protein|nr:hypothetical protein [Deltaproteobacteria bacterium]